MIDKKEAAASSLVVMHDALVTYLYIAPAGHTLDDCKRPDYWRQNARELKLSRYSGQLPRHKIVVIADDNSWEAEFRVLGVDPSGLVTTRLLSHVSGEAPGKRRELPDGYRVEHLPNVGWRALDPNSSILIDACPLEDNARQAVFNHARKAA